jgi:hypothetical protein
VLVERRRQYARTLAHLGSLSEDRAVEDVDPHAADVERRREVRDGHGA